MPISKDKGKDYQNDYAAFDNARSLAHNSMISNISILNRLCQKQAIPLVYDGIVSKEQPHRVEIADAALAYIEELVKSRKK